jgi:hypothetical protein
MERGTFDSNIFVTALKAIRSSSAAEALQLSAEILAATIRILSSEFRWLVED